MARTFTYLRRIVLALGLLLLLLAIGLGIYSNTEAFRQMVREQVVAAINSSIRGSITLERIEGSIWGNVTLHQVRLRYQNAEIVHIPQLELSYALLPLFRGRLQVTRADASEPAVRVVRDRHGDWNIAEALASDTESQAQWTVLLKSLALRGGDLEIRLEGDAPQRYHLKNLSVASRLAILPTGIEFEAGAVSARLESGKLPELGLRGSLAYQDAGSLPTIKVDDLRIATAASRLKLSGQLVGFDKSRIDARLALDSLAPADVARLLPDWPVQKAVTGQIEAKGLFDALALTAELAASGTKLDSKLTVNVLTPTPSFRGTIKLAGFDARALLGAKQWAGVLDGDAKVEGAGFDVAQINASGVFAVRALQVKDRALGDLRLNALLRDGVASLDGALSGNLGSADWRGRVRLTQAPSYEFDLAVNNLDINKVSADAQAPRGAVSFKGKVQGSGLALDKMKVQAHLEVLPSTVGPVQVRAGELDAAYGDGRIRIARASLRSADSTITVKGDLGTALDHQGKLDYDLRSENLTPWLALAGRKGAGALTLTGSAQGNLAELTARGLVKASRLQLDGFSAGSGAIDFDLAHKRGEAIPTGNIVARLADLRAGAELQKLDATIKLISHGEMQIEARAQDSFSREHRFKGSLDFGAPDKVARINQLSLNLPDGNWNLAQPATLTQRGETFWVERFTLRNQERQATLDGQVSLRGTQALNLTADRVPLESLAALLPKQTKMAGLMSLQAKVGGSAAAPLISADLKLTDSTLGDQKYQGLVAEISYRERQADVSLTLQQDSNHSLNATGKLPLLLSWQDGWRSEVTGALDMRIKSAGLSAAFLNAYAAKEVRDIGGEVSLDVTARGALLEPRLSGSLRLTGGKLKLTALNVEVTEIGTEVSFDQQRLTMANFSARADEGRLTGSGVLSLKRYQIENLKFALEARRWPAIQTRRYQAQIGGNVELTGPLSAPKLVGRVDIIEANLRPDLASLKQSSTPVKRDETIVVVNRDGSRRAETTPNSANNGQGDDELFKKLALDLEVRMARNVWVRHPDAVAELRGQVRATKISGQELQLVGLTEIIRGWAAFQGRRFDFVRGDIRFIGGAKVDPALDIVAQYRLPQYTVDAVVGGTAQKPSLVLRSDPVLDQSDILALLVFGKTTKDLGRGEQLSLKQNALDVTSGFAAAKIGSAVAEAIGLDTLGFDLGDFDFSGGRIGYGRYIGRRTYVSLSQELAGERGQKATVEYQMSPEWKVESSTTSEGTSGIDLIWHKRY